MNTFKMFGKEVSPVLEHLYSCGHEVNQMNVVYEVLAKVGFDATYVECGDGSIFRMIRGVGDIFERGQVVRVMGVNSVLALAVGVQSANC